MRVKQIPEAHSSGVHFKHQEFPIALIYHHGSGYYFEFKPATVAIHSRPSS